MIYILSIEYLDLLYRDVALIFLSALEKGLEPVVGDVDLCDLYSLISYP